MLRARPLLFAALAVTAFTATTATAVGAQVGDTHYYEAEANALDLRLFGTDVASLAGTRALTENDAATTAQGYSIGIGDTRIGLSSATAATRGSSQRDPDGNSLNCSIPGLPGELGALANAVVLANVCSSSIASIDEAGIPTALADASGGSVSVNGQVISSLLLDVLLVPVSEQLDAALEPIEASVVGPVAAALDAVCEQLPAGLTVADVVRSAESAGLPIREVILALPDGEAIFAALGEDCVLSLSALLELRDVLVTLAEDQVRQLLTGVLDRDLLTISLGGSTSGVSVGGGAVRVAASTQGVSVTSPSLEFVLTAIEGQVAQLVDQAIADVTAIVPAQLGQVLAAIPTSTSVTSNVFAALPLDQIIDDQPLLTLTVSPSRAIARFDGPEAGVNTSESTAAGATLTLSAAIARLLGVDPIVTVTEGQDVPIAVGTPLESRISVGTIEQLSETLGASQVATNGVRVQGVNIALLKGLDGGIEIGVASATARAGGTLVVRTTAAPAVLARTGAESTVSLIGAAFLIGAALYINRRRIALG